MADPHVTDAGPDDVTLGEYEAWVIDQQSPDYHG